VFSIVDHAVGPALPAHAAGGGRGEVAVSYWRLHDHLRVDTPRPAVLLALGMRLYLLLLLPLLKINVNFVIARQLTTNSNKMKI